MRLFNLREGFTAAHDVLPPRFYQPKYDGSPVKAIDRAAMDKARGYYYTCHRLDANGVPLPEKTGGTRNRLSQCIFDSQL